MRAVALIEAALTDLFASLDDERFDQLARRLEVNVELADELTGEWLRGRQRVAAYLRAQTGIVTDVTSLVSSATSRWLTRDLGLVTFLVRQRYRLGGVPREELLMGSAIFSFSSGAPLLTLFHLGTAANARASANSEDTTAVAAGSPSTKFDQRGSVGAAIRRCREEAGLSLRALAGLANLSPSFLSQLERGLAEPSITSLRRLAGALDVSLLTLLGDPSVSTAARDLVIRRQARRRVTLPDSGLVQELLSSEVSRRIDARIETLDPGASTSAQPRSHAGEEFVLVLEGRLQLVYGEETLDLHSGDAVTIDASIAHRIVAEGGVPLRYLSVLSPSLR